MCEAGGTNHLLARTLIDEIDIDVPEITLNLPKTGFGSQARNYSDQRNLYHNNEDLVWDYASNIHLTNDIHHHRPNIAPPNSGNPFMTPPLASSTRYPNLPINFYGSNIPSLPHSINQQNQQNVSLAQLTVTPQPNLSGLTGSQLGVTATITSVTTPILSLAHLLRLLMFQSRELQEPDLNRLCRHRLLLFSQYRTLFRQEV